MNIQVLALLGGLICYFLYVRSKNKGKCGLGSTVDSGKRVRRMTSVGFTTLLTETHLNRSIPMSYMIVEGKLARQDIIDRLNERIKSDRFLYRFRSIVSGQSRKYVEYDQFDASDHVHLLNVSDDPKFTTILEEYINQPLDFSKPLWALYIWYIRSDKNGEMNTVVVVTVHHCLGDGASFFASFFKWTDSNADALNDKIKNSAREEKNHRKSPSRGPIALCANMVHSILRIVHTTPTVLRKALNILFQPEPATCFKHPPTGKKRVAFSKPYDIKHIKNIGKQLGATVNDLVLHCTASAMRQIIIRESFSIRYNTVLRAAVPISMRNANREIEEPGNEFSSLIVELPVGISDTSKRLNTVSQNATKAKASIERFVVYYTLKASSFVPEALARSLSYFTTSKFSVAISNNYFPVQGITLLGLRELRLGGFVPPPPGVNLGVYVCTIGSALSVNVSVDEAVGVNADVFVTLFEEALAELSEATRI